MAKACQSTMPLRKLRRRQKRIPLSASDREGKKATRQNRLEVLQWLEGGSSPLDRTIRKNLALFSLRFSLWMSHLLSGATTEIA
jgi:hypothetical protein